MAGHPPCPPEELLWTIAVARLLLPAEVHVQAPPNLSDDLAPCSTPGIDDWGGVSPVTADHVNPERAWPALDVLRGGHRGGRRTPWPPGSPSTPTFALDPERWLDPAMRFPVLDATDAEGLAREDRWCSGGEAAPPDLRRRRTRAPGRPGRGRQRRGRGAGRGGPGPGGRRGRDRHPVLGPGPRGAGRGRGGRRAAARRVGDDVTCVANRNINYTNVCTFKCRFCAFSKGPLSLNLRGDALPARARRDHRAGGRGRGGGRHRGVPAGRHPPEVRRRLLPRRDPGRAGRVRAHPHPRLHRPGGDRGGPALRGAPGRLPGAG